MFRSRQSLDDKSSPPSLATYHGHADHFEMQRSRTRGSSGGAETPRRNRRQGGTISPVRPRFSSQRNSISSIDTPKARKTKNARVSLSPGKDGLRQTTLNFPKQNNYQFSFTASSSTSPVRSPDPPTQRMRPQKIVSKAVPSRETIVIEESSSESDDDDDSQFISDGPYAWSEDENEPQRYDMEKEISRMNIPAKNKFIESSIINKPYKVSSELRGKDPIPRFWGLTRRCDVKINDSKSKPLRLGPEPIIGINRRIQSGGTALSSRLNMFSCYLNIPKIRLSCSHKKMAGAITSIAQSGEYIACVSAVSGGSDESSELDPYNRNGAFVVWKGSDYTMINGHSRPLVSGDMSKYYTVNGVAFDPSRPEILISSGDDKRMLAHRIKKDTEGGIKAENICERDHPGALHHIMFKPQSSIFAVGSTDGNLYIYDKRYISISYNLDPLGQTGIGYFLWGTGRQENILFASTETNDYSIRCHHSAFDTAVMREVFKFNTRESGDSMAINPTGSNLALVTNTDEHNTLSLYDIGRRDGTRPISTQELRRARPNLDSPINGRNEALEVTCASYSPDGNLIALGRNDSEVDVYDVRFLGERGGAWARISHPRKTRVERGMKDDYGCQHLAWVQGISGFGGGGGHRKGGGRVGMDSGWGTGLGLVTGASDGCVRLWDISRSPKSHEESMILSNMSYDIGNFILGDPTKQGERRLVVGDCGGEVHIYD